MRPHKHARGESTGYMRDHLGHEEWIDTTPPDPRVFDRSEPRAVVERRRRHDGWTAERQVTFLASLAETGSVALAAEAADITARSAYRLRCHPDGAAFARAWDAALATAATRLTAVAFERAVHGARREVWRGGELVAESRVPSDRLLMFLLRNLAPHLFGDRPDIAARAGTLARGQADFVPALAALTDMDAEADLLDPDDYRPRRPRQDEA
jgi:hypothetical protein